MSLYVEIGVPVELICKLLDLFRLYVALDVCQIWEAFTAHEKTIKLGLIKHLVIAIGESYHVNLVVCGSRSAISVDCLNLQSGVTMDN